MASYTPRPSAECRAISSPPSWRPARGLDRELDAATQLSSQACFYPVPVLVPPYARACAPAMGPRAGWRESACQAPDSPPFVSAGLSANGAEQELYFLPASEENSFSVLDSPTVMPDLRGPDLSEGGNWGCYGNIRTLDTPGASCGIGRRRGLNYCGVRASERLAEIDMPYLLRYQPMMRTVGQKYCVDPAVIAGVMSREYPGGNILVHAGNVDDGIRVVQDTGHYVPTSWISESQLSQMTEVLTVRIKEIQRRFPTWSPDQCLRGGLCAYVGGPSYVRSSQDLGCDFCNDVLARAKYFKRHGF